MTIKKKMFAWALYDWANSAFSTTVLVGFFPIFFREHWAQGEPSHQITFYLGAANSLASFLVVLIAPVLGAIADQGNLRRQMLIVFSAFGIAMTAGLFWVQAGQWGWALGLFVAATVGWMGANVFYDALLADVSERSEFDLISAFGYALGYLGGGLMFAGCVAMTLRPDWFGLAGKAEAVMISFLLVAFWWLIFSLPLWFSVGGGKQSSLPPLRKLVQQGFAQLYQTFCNIRQYRPILVFLLAYWFYIDGVDTVIRMAVDFGKARGIGTNDLIKALLITQFIGFPAALIFGWIGNRIGARRGILIGIFAYSVITIFASQMRTAQDFYVLAGCVGLVQGGVQSLSRSYYASLIPVDRAAEFFGFYNFLGKFAAILGPLMVGWVGMISGSEQIGLVSVLLLFLIGGVILFYHQKVLLTS